MNIFVVKAHCSDYDGGTSYVVRAFHDKEEAEQLIKNIELKLSDMNEASFRYYPSGRDVNDPVDYKLLQSYRQEKLHKYWSVRREHYTIIREFDPYYHDMGSGTEYTVEEVELT